MALTTRLGLHGTSAAPFGSFAGKSQTLLVVVTETRIRLGSRVRQIIPDPVRQIRLSSRVRSITVEDV